MAQNFTSRILMTGAAGFIGSVTTAALARQFGLVVAGVHRLGISDLLRISLGVSARVCDLDNARQVRTAVAGVDIVVHAAYGAHDAMVTQCATLLEAMTQAGVSRLVYISSIAVYGRQSGRVDESQSALGTLGPYAAAKRGCETLIERWSQDPAHNRRALILRPGIVYGTGSRFWIDKMVERIQCGAWGDFGKQGEGVAALIHVDDLAAMIVRSCQMLETGKALAPCTPLNAIGPETPRWNQYFKALAIACTGRPLQDLPPDKLAWRQGLAVLAKIWRRLGLPGAHRHALAPTGGEMALFSIDAHYTNQRAQEILGFRPAIGLAEGLARTSLTVATAQTGTWRSATERRDLKTRPSRTAADRRS